MQSTSAILKSVSGQPPTKESCCDIKNVGARSLPGARRAALEEPDAIHLTCLLCSKSPKESLTIHWFTNEMLGSLSTLTRQDRSTQPKSRGDWSV